MSSPDCTCNGRSIYALREHISGSVEEDQGNAGFYLYYDTGGLGKWVVSNSINQGKFIWNFTKLSPYLDKKILLIKFSNSTKKIMFCLNTKFKVCKDQVCTLIETHFLT